MKRAVQVAVVVLAGTLLLQAADRKKRVAIFDFDYGTVHNQTSALFGSNVDVGKGIADLLVKYLVKDGTYSVIERKALDKILAEQNFSTSDRANPASAAKIGKILGVDALIIGSITQFGGEDKSTGVGGGGGGWGGFGLGGIKHKKSKAIVAVDARLVDIDTAEILAVADGKGESTRSSTSVLGGGGNWRGFGAGGVDFSSSNFQETIIGEAVKAAVEQMSAGVIGANAKLQTRQVIVSGLVAFIEGANLVLNVGVKSGLKAGDKLSVERVTREIKDPATGAVIRRMASQIGTIEVTELDEGSAVAKILNGAGFKVGDVVKTVTQ
ncbi:MAG TPA: CsgG/HfaB family protein [Terriglobales bacterium]|jgi:curli biogenesis system outer membrane secretion channel CsgG|nr:CsgG/HfaB family protein [Terriglobales bacterium]